MNRKINTYRSLLHLVDFDETDHIIKDLAKLFLEALNDWPTDSSQDIVKCVQEFKYCFGNPFTFVNGHIVHFKHVKGWKALEVGSIVTKMVELSIEHFDTADFDVIVDRVLSYYEQKFLMTSAQRPIQSTGCAYFCIWTLSEEKEVDYIQWLSHESDKIENIEKLFRPQLLLNEGSTRLILRMVKRLTPFKDRLIALKQAHPDLHFELIVLFWTDPLYLWINLDNETLQFLAETGIEFRSELFVI